MPLRSTSMTPRLPISFARRARNWRRVGRVRLERELLDELGLRGLQEATELDEVDAGAAVVVPRVAEQPAGAASTGGEVSLGTYGGESRSIRPVMCAR